MRLRSSLVTAVAMPLLLATAAPILAQDGFMFKQPIASLTVRLGPNMHSAKSDVFDFFTSELTLDRDDFRAPSLGAELGIMVSPKADVLIGVSWSEVNSKSEFRDWVDQDDQPIEQRTKLRTIPLTASVRYYPLSRGETVSELAWVPRRVTPYVGGGGGITWYNLDQQGDFIQMSDLSVFFDDFESSGNALTTHLIAGSDVWLSSKAGVNLEARYTRGSAPLTGDFQNWNDLDLSGFQVSAGFTFRW
jgi:hypothetical protein